MIGAVWWMLLLWCASIVGSDGVLGVVVVVILQLFPVTVRDIVVVNGLMILVVLWNLHSGPLPLCMCTGVIHSLMDMIPRLITMRVVVVVMLLLWLSVKWNGVGIEWVVRWICLVMVVRSLLRWV